MRIYIDMCAMKRPFDDLLQPRISIEAAAVEAMLKHCREGGAQLVSSDALRFENSRDPNETRREMTAKVLEIAQETVPNSLEIELRAAELQGEGIRLLDALHLSSAESAGADVFCTCDDELVARLRRVRTRCRVLDPTELLREVCA